MEIEVIGLDLPKSEFQANVVDAERLPDLVNRLHRKQMVPLLSKLPFLIRVEVCPTAHHWVRTLGAVGHEVGIVPPSCVKGYAERGKSDALDTEAICEAVQRPAMHFVLVKTIEQQGILPLLSLIGAFADL